jgi:hypothetical protein
VTASPLGEAKGEDGVKYGHAPTVT